MEEMQKNDRYRVIEGQAHGEITEKKSRFIASLSFVETEAEAEAFVESVRKKYYDARHNCFAFLVGAEGGTERCSDDGEPSGTAGRPMLDALRGAELTNVAAVVTRYFGGTLLGTGGLVRAYTQAVQDALDHAVIRTMRRGVRYLVTVDYSLTGKMQHLFAKRGISVEDAAYTDTVRFCILVPAGLEEAVKRDIIEITAAKARIEEGGSVYYAGE